MAEVSGYLYTGCNFIHFATSPCHGGQNVNIGSLRAASLGKIVSGDKARAQHLRNKKRLSWGVSLA